MKLSKLFNEKIFAQEEKIGEVKDAYIDSEKWKITHLEIKLNKEPSKEILGAKTSIRNSLTISALRRVKACCTERGLELKLSKSQLHIYLRPPE